MSSFEEILKRPGSEIKAPEAYPVGEYHCLVDGPPEPGKSSQKGTDYLRFKYRIIAPFKGVDEAKAAEQQVTGKIITEDFYILDNTIWRLKEMLKNLGIDGLDDAKSPFEALPEAPGRQLLVTLRHETSPDGKRVFHRVASTAHV